MNTYTMTVKTKEEMTDEVIRFMVDSFEDFRTCKRDYEEALASLRREIGDEKIEQLKNAICERTAAQLVFCETLGFNANLESFRNPERPNFYEKDFEVYLKTIDMESVHQHMSAEKVIADLFHSLTETQKGVFDNVQEYLVYLECTVPKLAHYKGFMLGNSLLEYIEPRYSPNCVLTVGYKAFLEKWLGVNLGTTVA